MARAMDLIARVNQVANDLYFQHIDTDGPTPRQLAILRAISSQPGLSQIGISAVTGIDRSTAADIVSRLIRKGWVTRVHGAGDARAYAVRLTEPGSVALLEAAAVANTIEVQLLGALPAVRRADFLQDLFAIAIPDATRDRG